MKKLIWSLGVISLVLTSCEETFEPCDNVVCMNGGTCVDGFCDCPTNFTGPDCSIELNACDNEPYVYYNDKTYDIQVIDDRCWFTENLQTDKFANGEPITKKNYYNQVSTSTTPVYFDANQINEGYGFLYNFYTIEDERGLCPPGWHVSNDNDWYNLEDHIGISPQDIYDGPVNNLRGMGLGHKLKSNEDDLPSWDGIDEVGLSLVPSGEIHSSDYSQVDANGRGHECWIWTSNESTEYENLYVCRTLYSSTHGSQDWNNIILRKAREKNTAMAVRCVKD